MGDVATEIQGVELGERVIRYPVKQDPRMAVFIANVCVDGTGSRREPTLIVGRQTMGRGRSFMIPLSSAWMYNELDLIDDKASLAATLLFGPNPTPGECRVCADVILQYLPDLFAFAPDSQGRLLSAGLERVLEQYRVHIQDTAGNVIMDARA